MDKEVKDKSLKSGSGDQGPLDLALVADAIQKNRETVTEEGAAGSGEQEPEDLSEDLGLEPEKGPVFTEKKIRNLIKMPFELAFVKTGCEGVRITDPEIELVLEDTVDVMNALVKVNPLWLAVFGLTVNGAVIVSSKVSAYSKFKKDKAANAQERK